MGNAIFPQLPQWYTPVGKGFAISVLKRVSDALRNVPAQKDACDFDSTYFIARGLGGKGGAGIDGATAE
jgi:hypothetical protein